MKAKTPTILDLGSLVEDLSDEELATCVGGMGVDLLGFILPPIPIGVTLAVPVLDQTVHAGVDGSVRCNCYGT